MMALLEVQHLKKVYKNRLGTNETIALKDVDFSVMKGEFVSIMGESGSGKTTLLNLLSTLDVPSEGEILLAGKVLSKIKQADLSQFRREQLGFVFQDFNLLDNFSLKDNILLPLVLANTPYKIMEELLQPLARQLGIDHLLDNYPYEVSGGQKQRAAVARALITQPQLVLADEPTGALDSRSSQELLQLFERIHQAGQTILMVTHSVKAASHSSRVLFIRDGRVYHELYRGNQKPEQFMNQISQALFVSLDRGE